jgi:hypothetical protein
MTANRGISLNHNEIVVRREMPPMRNRGISLNHNETSVRR